MQRIQPSIEDTIFSIICDARSMARQQINDFASQCLSNIQNMPDKDKLKQYLTSLQESLPIYLQQVQRVVQQDVARRANEAAEGFEGFLLDDLRQRYRLVQQATTLTGAWSADDWLGADLVGQSSPVDPGFSLSVKEFEDDEQVLSVGGAAAGAAIGTCIMPVLGTMIGGYIGWWAGRAMANLDTLKQQCSSKLAEYFNNITSDIDHQLLSSQETVKRSLTDAISVVHQQALNRFGQWIGQVIRSEEQTLTSEHEKLRHLLDSQARLRTHQTRLSQLMKVAAQQSVALCK